MSTRLAVEVLPDLAAVALSFQDAPAGALEVLRTDANGTHPVRQLEGQQTSAGTLALVDYEPALVGAVQYQFLGTRTNTLANPSFETDVSGWTTSGGNVLTRDTSMVAVAAGGVASAKVASSTAASALVYAANATPTAPGETWTASGWITGTAGQTVRFGIAQYTAAGVSVGAVPYVTITLDGTWQRISVTRAITDATVGGVRPIVVNGSIGQVYWLDGLMLEEAPQLGSYLEGTQDAVMVATVNSVLTSNPVLAVVGDPVNAAAVTALRSYGESSDSETKLLPIKGGGGLALVDGLGLRVGSIGLHAATYQLAAQLRDMLRPGVLALLRQPTYAGLDLYLTPERVRIDPAPEDTDPREWVVTVDYTERPFPALALESSSAWTWDDVLATVATWDDVPSTFATWHDLAVGP